MRSVSDATAAPVIGALTGLRAEARLLAPYCRIVLSTGGMREPGPADLRDLIAQGATALLSIGVCGGLDPAVPVGTVIVPEIVVLRGTLYVSDIELSARFGDRGQVLLSTPAPLATRAAKADAFALGACAVDLETGMLARVAQEAGLPWAALRVVCDPANRDLPAAALAALDASGRIRLGSALHALSFGQVPGLVRLALDAAAARRSLKVALRRADWP